MKKTVLVTAIGSFAGESVIAGCKREGFRVVGCDIYPAEWVANSMDTDVFYQAPYAADTDKYRSFLKRVCKEEQVKFLIPLTDAEIDVLQAWRLEPASDYGDLGATVCISGEQTITRCRDKELAAALLQERGVCLTIPGQRLSEIDMESLGEMDYPLIVKPRDGRSSQGLQIVESSEQMAFVVKSCGNRADCYLVQPRIEGTVVTVDVVRDPESGVCACLPRRELLRTLNGCGTSVYVFRDEKLERQCREIAAVLDIRGCVNMEFIEQGSNRYFLECNPRFSGGAPFSHMAGYDLTRNHLGCFMGQKPQLVQLSESMYAARRYGEYKMKTDSINTERGRGIDEEKT